MDDNVKVLNEIDKGCKMAMDSIDMILNRDIDDKNFVDELNHEFNEYSKISSDILTIYDKYSDEKPKDISTLNKVMLWSGIEMKTILNESNSKLADIMMNGVNMGIIEGIKMKNNNRLNKEVENIVCEYIKTQQNNYENLKKFL